MRTYLNHPTITTLLWLPAIIVDWLPHNRRSQLAWHRCHHHRDRSGRSLHSTATAIRGLRSPCYTPYSGSRTVRRDIRMEQHTSCIPGGDTGCSICCLMCVDDVLEGLYKELCAHAPSDLDTSMISSTYIKDRIEWPVWQLGMQLECRSIRIYPRTVGSHDHQWDVQRWCLRPLAVRVVVCMLLLGQS